nr:RNA-directed DNA polymerase, eukaryota [Tanacetum cinerariifolium]
PKVKGLLWGFVTEVVGNVWSDGVAGEVGERGVVEDDGKNWLYEQWFKRGLEQGWLFGVNLIRRGVTLEPVNCPFCLSCEEDAHHIFFRCDLVQAVLRRVCRWWELDWQPLASFRIGSCGFPSFGFLPRLSVCSKEFFTLLGGPFGYCGTALSLTINLLLVRPSLIISCLYLFIGALIDVIACFLGKLGLKTLI